MKSNIKKRTVKKVFDSNNPNAIIAEHAVKNILNLGLDPKKAVVAIDNDLRQYVDAPYGIKKAIIDPVAKMIFASIKEDISNFEKKQKKPVVNKEGWYSFSIKGIMEFLIQWQMKF